MYLWLPWVFMAACGLFSSCGGRELHPNCGVRASHCGGFSCCSVWALQRGLSSCRTRAELCSKEQVTTKLSAQRVTFSVKWGEAGSHWATFTREGATFRGLRLASRWCSVVCLSVSRKRALCSRQSAAYMLDVQIQFPSLHSNSPQGKLSGSCALALG